MLWRPYAIASSRVGEAVVKGGGVTLWHLCAAQQSRLETKEFAQSALHAHELWPICITSGAGAGDASAVMHFRVESTCVY